MAAAGSWPSIRCHGLLSTRALLDLYEIDGEQRNSIECRHRPISITIEHAALGPALVRDQKPMSDKGLKRALQDGLAPSDWYQVLNGMTFFWLTRERLERFLCARSYAHDTHDVLTVETAALIGAYKHQIRFSPMNSGCTVPFPHPRGLRTFLPVDDYPYGERRNKNLELVVELAVQNGVPDIQRFVIRVDSMSCDKESINIWSR